MKNLQKAYSNALNKNNIKTINYDIHITKILMIIQNIYQL